MAKIRLYSAAKATPKLTPPEATDSHFFTAGRLLSYWPQINENGVIFFRDRCKAALGTLINTLTDVQHVKPGNDVPAFKGMFDNTSLGSISEIHEDEEGIDIISKNDRSIAKGIGLNPEDFAPVGGPYGNFSQECDHNPIDTTWVTVDKDDPTKVVAELSFVEGLSKGYKRSHVGADGQWQFYTDEKGNPVYTALTPTSFVGAGHVITPADPSAKLYAYAAGIEGGEKLLSSFYPGMEDTQPIFSSEPGALAGSDIYPMDATVHPELSAPSYSSPIMLNEDKFLRDGVPDESAVDSEEMKPFFKSLKKAKDHEFAALWEEPHPADRTKTVTKKALKVTNEKGELDRSRLVAAYHSLAGMRGHTMAAWNMPTSVQRHAMSYVRQGLTTTLKSKENSSRMADLNPTDAAAIQAKYDEIVSKQETDKRELSELKTEVESMKTVTAEQLAEKDRVISELQTQLDAHNSRELATTRLAELEAIHPFTAEEKTEDFVRSLASVSADALETIKVRRELAKMKVTAREVATRNTATGAPVNFLPTYEGIKREDITSVTVL